MLELSEEKNNLRYKLVQASDKKNQIYLSDHIMVMATTLGMTLAKGSKTLLGHNS